MKLDAVDPNGDSYSALSAAMFGALVKAHNAFAKKRDSLVIRLRGGTKPLTQRDYEAYGKIVKLIPELGMYNESRIGWVRSRALLRGYDSLETYCMCLMEDSSELEGLRENLTFVGSHFFRGDVWAELRKAIPETAASLNDDVLRVWCAGCSSGKEVYSVLMLLLDFLPAEKIDLLATDYNVEMLARCKKGVYPLSTIDEIPQQYRKFTQKHHAEKGERAAFAYALRFQFCESLRRMVRTERQNLLTDEYPEGFDLILCRNVIKFFDKQAIETVQEKLARSLRGAGLLVFSESDKEQPGNPEALQLIRLGDKGLYRKSV